MSGDQSRIRVGDLERRRAIELLEQQAAAGRLGPDELGQRTGLARDAVTRGDLDPLFADLPVDPPVGEVATLSAVPGVGDHVISGDVPGYQPQRSGLEVWVRRIRRFSGPVGGVVIAVAILISAVNGVGSLFSVFPVIFGVVAVMTVVQIVCGVALRWHRDGYL